MLVTAPNPEAMFEQGVNTARVKEDRLRALLRDMGSVLVAYSGGVDSTYLLAVGTEMLGRRALGVTAASPTLPADELAAASATAAAIGARHEVIVRDELTLPAFAANGPDRCYHCKDDLYGRLLALAVARGMAYVADGTNADDLADVRPGYAAARARGVRSPLVEVGMTKGEIRAQSRAWGLPTCDKPAQACLSSRVPTGTRITHTMLMQIEQCEVALARLGFTQVRVRHHGPIARIELAADEIARAADPGARAAIVAACRAAGFLFVTLDLVGYQTGSLHALARGGRQSTS